MYIHLPKMLHHRLTHRSNRGHRARYHGRGAGLGDWLKKAFNYVKEHKLISRGATMLAPRAGSYAPVVSTVGRVASALGFGRRGNRRYRGRGPHSSGLQLAGGYRRRVLA